MPIFNLRALSVILVNLRTLSVTRVHPRAFLSNLSLLKYFLRAREEFFLPRVSRSDQKATVVSVVVDWPGLIRGSTKKMIIVLCKCQRVELDKSKTLYKKVLNKY